MTEETRVCRKCGLGKPLCEFQFRKDKQNHRYECNICLSKRQAMYYIQNREKIINRRECWYIENRDYVLKHVKKYRKENYEKVREYHNTPQVKISNSLRCRIRISIKEQAGNKAYKTVELLGCSVGECRKYLESKFLPGMSWDNYGDWHIDHIIPCASFDLTKPEEQLKCFHYTNLQPLWATDNIKKSDKIQVLTSEGVFFV